MANVLVVDDDGAIRGLLRSVLRRDGYMVEEAADGVEALEKMRDRAFGAILLDLMMPRMNGWEVLDQLAREDRGRFGCIIVLSAALPKKGLQHGQQRSVYAMIPKPFNVDDLRAAVRGCVEQQEKPRTN